MMGQSAMLRSWVRLQVEKGQKAPKTFIMEMAEAATSSSSISEG